MDPQHETTQPSVTGDDEGLNGGGGGGEGNGSGGEAQESGAQRRIRELIEERKAAEARALAVEERAARERERYLEALAAARSVPVPKEPEEDPDLDPTERELRRLRRELDEFRHDQARSKDREKGERTLREIKDAVRQFQFDDAEDIRERLAAEAMANLAAGRSFDAEARASALFEREKARKERHRKEVDDLKAKVKTTAGDRPNSVLSGLPSGPPTIEPPTGAVPRIGTPERAAYDRQMRDSILAKHRA